MPLEKICKPLQYNIISVFNPINTLILCAYSQSIETQNNVQIHFIINERHEAILKLYKITNYTIIELDNDTINEILLKYNTPKKGLPFVFRLCESVQPEVSIWDSVKSAFQLQGEVLPDKPFLKKEILDNSNIIKNIGDLKKTILFIPSSDFLGKFNDKYWKNIAKYWSLRGYSIVSYIPDKNNEIKYTHRIEMTEIECLDLGMQCHKVYSTFNHLSSLLFERGKDLTIFYTFTSSFTAQQCQSFFSLNSFWDKNNISEKIIKTALLESKKHIVTEISLFNRFIYKKNIYNKKNKVTDEYLFGINTWTHKVFLNNVYSTFMGIPLFKTYCDSSKHVLKKYFLGILYFKDSNFINKADKKALKRVLRYIPKNKRVNILNIATGESYIFANFFEELEKKYPKTVWATYNKATKDIFDLYYPDKILLLPKKYHHYFSASEYVYKNIQFECFLGADFWKSFWAHKTHFIDAFCEKFQILPDYNNCKLPQVDLSIKDGLYSKINQIGLNIDKFVFISTEANSTELLPNIFWNELVNELKNNGYDIFSNTTSLINPIKNSKSCFLTYQEAYLLAQKSKAIIALRSGFTEILSSINVPKHIIYNLGENKINPWLKNLFENYTLDKYPNIKIETLNEYKHHEASDFEPISKNIIDSILKRERVIDEIK